MELRPHQLVVLQPAEPSDPASQNHKLSGVAEPGEKCRRIDFSRSYFRPYPLGSTTKCLLMLQKTHRLTVRSSPIMIHLAWFFLWYVTGPKCAPSNLRK